MPVKYSIKLHRKNLSKNPTSSPSNEKKKQKNIPILTILVNSV